MRFARGSRRVSALILATVLSAATTLADESPGHPARNARGDVPLDVVAYTPPKRLEGSSLEYPRVARQMGNEGWVNVAFMVDTAGVPYEIAVTDSTGDRHFEQAALDAARDLRFEPASLGGRPVEAGFSMKFSFSLTGPGGGAREVFAKKYRALSNAIGKQDRARAEDILASMKVANLYEDAYLGPAWFNYYRVWGTPAQQLDALQRAVAFEDDARYLPEDAFRRVLESIFMLAGSTNDFAQALAAWRKLEKLGVPPEKEAQLRSMVGEIESLRADDRSFVVEGDFGERTSWFISLLKKRFRIVVDEGELTEIKLRCDKRYVLFPYDPGLEYRILDDYGDCGMELIGDPGTRFRLAQS